MSNSSDIQSMSDGANWIRRLKVRHLQIFLTLEKSATLSEAAVHMHMTQSAVSHWLSDLEELVGTRLVVRDRRIRLTKAGEAFRHLAIRVLGDVVRTQEELRSIAGGAPEVLRIGGVSAGAAGAIPKAIVAYQAAHSDVTVRFEERGLVALIDSLEKRELDLVVGALDEQAFRPHLSHEVLAEEELTPIVRRGHPLINQQGLNWADLADYPWIMPARNTLVRSVLEGIFLQYGRADIQPSVETSSFLATEIILRESNYIAIASGTLANHVSELNFLCKLPLKEARLPLGVVWRRGDLPRIAEEFIKVLRTSTDRTNVGSCALPTQNT